MKSKKPCNPCSKGKPATPKANAIFPQAGGKKSKTTVNKGMLTPKANSVLGVSGYANSKAGGVDKSILSFKDNKISPTMDY